MTLKVTNKRSVAARKRFCSRAYGMVISSDIELPEFFPGKGKPDVEVFLEAAREDLGGDIAQWEFSPACVTCRFPRVGIFRITDGRVIRITPASGVDLSFLRLYVEGMMMAIILHQQGCYVLHSSVVKIGNVGAAFVGSVGAGKSSTAMALHMRGHMVVTDDNAAITVPLTDPKVIPAFPRIKLYPAIARSLGLSEALLQDLHSSQVKKTQSVAENFPVDPVSIDRIYCLTKNGPDRITRLTLPEAVIELVKVSVPGRWGLSGDARHLQETAQLARRLPVFRIRAFDSLESLPVLAAQIEEHCGFQQGERTSAAQATATEHAMSHAG